MDDGGRGFRGGGSCSGILTSCGVALGNDYIHAGRVPSGAGSPNGTYQVQIEIPFPQAAAGLSFLPAKNPWHCGGGPSPSGTQPPLRFRRFKDAADGS